VARPVAAVGHIALSRARGQGGATTTESSWYSAPSLARAAQRYSPPKRTFSSRSEAPDVSEHRYLSSHRSV